jgi:hypothetical protein
VSSIFYYNKKLYLIRDLAIAKASPRFFQTLSDKEFDLFIKKISDGKFTEYAISNEINIKNIKKINSKFLGIIVIFFNYSCRNLISKFNWNSGRFQINK